MSGLKSILIKNITAALLLLSLYACKSRPVQKTYFPDAFSYSKIVKHLNDVVKLAGLSPVVAARNYTYANIAAYECVAAGNPKEFQSLNGQLNEFKIDLSAFINKKIDYNFASLLAYARVGETVSFPEGSMKDYVDSLKNLVKEDGMPSDMFDNSSELADSAANAVLEWSKKDRYAQTRSGSRYELIDSPGRWVPTPPAYSSALEPHWKEIRPMVMESATQFAPAPPIPYNIKDTNSAYYKQVMDIKHAIDSLTPEQKHIADFWDDLNGHLNVSGHTMFVTKKFSPPGHWMNIVGIAAQKSKAGFGKTVAAYTITSVCMFDAFIQSWESKFRYNMIRPETVINESIDQDWRPYLQTPPFPEYTCGHCTISAASAEALTKIFGDNFSYTDSSELEFGIANRSYQSFRQASLENEYARFYGGIHYFPSNTVAHECGKNIGDYIVGKLKMEK
jgi:hypothetical protein